MPIATINPATGETVQTFVPLTPAQLEQKLQRAAEAFKQHKGTPYADRAERMRRAADILDSGSARH